MKIVIDARLYNQSGVGRYLHKLIENLALIDRKNQYVIFLTAQDFQTIKLPNNNFQKRLVDISWHSIAEQLLLPVYLISEKPDLVHFPYFSVPLFYRGKFIITIHDLIIDHFDTGRASTRNLLIYKLKRLCYKIIIKSAILRANKIIAVSQSTKKEIIDHYHISAGKIMVTYEAADLNRASDQRLVAKDYLLYVGNAYPHKNLERLIDAFQKIKTSTKNLKLILVGKKDYFYQRLEKNLPSLEKKDIVFFGYADSQQLANLYTHAQALVFPSLMEGFGLPGLEAMKIGTPVACSDIPVFKEIYQESACYFNPLNVDEMAAKIKKVVGDQKIRNKLIKLGHQQVKKYSWQKMARETLEVYEKTKDYSI